MALTVAEVEHIAQLARLGLHPDEAERYRDQLARLLDHFQRLRELDTEDVPATGHAGELSNVLRSDEARPSSLRDDILDSAPRRKGDHLLVPPVLEF